MNLFSIKSWSVTLGAIALIAAPLSLQARAEDASCLEPFAGIELNERQIKDIEQLETQFDTTASQIWNLSPEEEARWEQAEAELERKFKENLSPQQVQQLDQLEQWEEQQMKAILPGGFSELDNETQLTPQQEAALNALGDEYQRRLQAILSEEQMQALEEQFEKEIEALMPNLTAEQEAKLTAAEQTFDRGLQQVLTPEQRQQFERNNATCN